MTRPPAATPLLFASLVSRWRLGHFARLCESSCATPLSAPAAALQAVDAGAGRKVFDLQLDQLGPYSLDFSRSGRHMLLAGRKGHLALMDWQRTRLICEVQVGWCQGGQLGRHPAA